MAARIRIAATLLTLPLLLGACGQTAKDSAKDFKGEQAKVAQAVEDLQSAGQRRDSGKICDELLTPGLRKQIQTASKATCASALDDRLSDADAFELQVQSVTIDGDRATAVVSSEAGDSKRRDTLQLQRDKSGAWQIATLG
ncbi:MAG TPA: hypothetical protein VFT50_12030 [Baekduia sp.]|nr:hypothetical protein [Baekduia sp.]